MLARERNILVLLRILAYPYRYTKKELAKHFEVSKDTIKDDIQAIINVGIHFEQDSKYRCAVIPDQQFKELKHLQSLTIEERTIIGNAVDRSCSSKDALYLKNKLASLYNFQKLGIRALRRPALERIDALENAKKQKLQVVLANYKSNSNSIKDRLVEPFLVDPELDTLQAYDAESKKTRHFKLNRIERVILTDTKWQFEKQHEHKYTDVFRISDNNQIVIHLRLQVYAYNALTETYPKALSEVIPAASPNTFDFETKVNHQFLGLMNFIMGNFEHIEVIAPEELKEKIKEKASAILEKIKKE